MKMLAPRNQSSHIKELGHDPETNTLAVTFHKGGTYHYPGVTEEQYRVLHEHDSPGSHFHRHIKPRFKGRPA